MCTRTDKHHICCTDDPTEGRKSHMDGQSSNERTDITFTDRHHIDGHYTWTDGHHIYRHTSHRRTGITLGRTDGHHDIKLTDVILTCASASLL